MINLRENYWAVEVPEGLLSPFYSTEQSINRMLSGESGDDELIISYTQRKCGSPSGKITVKIPPATWEIICTSKEATEELLKVMDDVLQHNNFKEWFQNFNGRLSYYYNRLSSFNSLLTSKGCDLNNNYLILKKG